jgi:hypothetical protein
MSTTIQIITGDETASITVSPGARGPNSVTSLTDSDGTAELYIDSLRFEATNGGPTQLGELAWESADGSIDAMLESGVIAAMGEDLLIRVRNVTDDPIAKGDPIAYDGTTGASGRLHAKKWVGANIPTAKLFLGFAANAMGKNQNGYAVWQGKLDGIDTDGGVEDWQDEQIIYAVPGASATLTNVAPTAGEYASAAVVVNASSGTSGILYVRPSFDIARPPQSTTFDGLPSASASGAGARSFITNCSTNTFLSTAAGGGANAVPVVSNGSIWLVG